MKREYRMIPDTAFVLALFLIFALFALSFVLFGAKIYTGTVAKMQKNYELRASLSYVANKIHTADRKDGLLLQQLSGTDVLAIPQEIEGEHYVTYIYYYEGELCELFVSEDMDFDPLLGTPIVSLESFSFTPQETAILLTAQDVSLRVELRAGGILWH